MHSSRAAFSSLQTQHGWRIISLLKANIKGRGCTDFDLCRRLALWLQISGEVIRCCYIPVSASIDIYVASVFSHNLALRLWLEQTC